MAGSVRSASDVGRCGDAAVLALTHPSPHWPQMKQKLSVRLAIAYALPCPAYRRSAVVHSHTRIARPPAPHPRPAPTRIAR